MSLILKKFSYSWTSPNVGSTGIHPWSAVYTRAHACATSSARCVSPAWNRSPHPNHPRHERADYNPFTTILAGEASRGGGLSDRNPYPRPGPMRAAEGRRATPWNNPSLNWCSRSP